MKTSEGILIMLLSVLIVVMFYGIYLMKTEGTKCILSPITYGMQKLEKVYEEKIDCFCSDGISINSTGIMKTVTYNYPKNKFGFSTAG